MKLSLASCAIGAFAALCSAAATPSNAASNTVTFDNNRRFLFDTDGKQIDAYGSKVQVFDGKYYLYGNSFSVEGVAYGIKSYSSLDLQTW